MLELTAQQAIERVPAGAILLTQNQASELTDAINGGQSLESGEVASFGHAMRMARDGQVWSQEWRLKQLPLERWQGCYLRAWINPAYGPEDFTRLLDETELRKGTRYDWLATIIGQPLRFILPSFITDHVQIPWLNMCSEGVAEVERKLTPAFCQGTKRPSPQNIDNWCNHAGWRCITFKLI